MKGRWSELVRRWKGTLGQYRYVALVLAAGICLLLLPDGDRDGPAQAPAGQESAGDSFDLAAFEERVAGALSQIRGAGQVEVVLSLDSGSRQVLARDREQDGAGQSSTVVTVGRSDRGQEVVPLQTISPQFRGALVVCAGGGDPQVRLQMIAAVSALTGLGADRIEVCERDT